MNGLDKTLIQCGYAFNHVWNADQLWGYELEIEGENLPRAPRGWSVHDEGSLRGGPGRAHEYVVSVPLSGQNLAAHLTSLENALTAPGVTTLPNFRCSVHVHRNVQNEKWGDILAFVTVFSALEPMLLALCGEQRNGNLFCMSSYETGDLAEWFRATSNSVSQGQYRVNGRGKYAALNVDPIQTFGSVEVRCFPAVIEANKAMEFITWLENMWRLMHEQDDRSMRTLVDDVYQRPEYYADRVFTGRPVPGVQMLGEMGAETAYEFARLHAKALRNEIPEPKAKATKAMTLGQIRNIDIAAIEQQMNLIAPQVNRDPWPEPAPRWDEED